MTLESVLTSINKSAEGNKGLVLATGLYISAAILDNTLTYFGVTYGLEKEWNPVTQFYMDELGYGKGLIVSELLTYITFLGAREYWKSSYNLIKFLQRHHDWPIFASAGAHTFGAFLWAQVFLSHSSHALNIQ